MEQGLGVRARVRAHLSHARVAADLDYFSLLRPLSELAVARAFARHAQYDDVFSSCNRNFRILGERPADRWCGQCPKCHFVFLALAPFMPKPRLLAIFGRNLLDDAALAPAFDALLEYRDHKPFECVGEGARIARGDGGAWRSAPNGARTRWSRASPRRSRRSSIASDLALDALLAPRGRSTAFRHALRAFVDAHR